MSHSVSSALIHTESYNSASAIPDDIWDCLRSNPRTSNILYPYAAKAMELEVRRGARPSEGNFWIVCYSMSRGSGSVDFVLSCTDGPLGTYPIFIWSYPGQSLSEDYLSPRIASLIQKLLQRTGVHRVYSVFSIEPVTRMFAHLWTRATGISIIREPYYSAKLTWCSRESLTNSRCPPPPDVAVNLRIAEERDSTQVAELCHGFASTSDPFFLSTDGAIKEASVLIANRQLWVHEIRRPGGRPEIASIVAVTRTSETVSAITKVYTNPAWRRKNCAERLVREVCQRLLYEGGKQYVVLYVAHDNTAAEKVYHRVGFVGLCENAHTNFPAVESWWEVGFDRSRVELGHW